MRWNERRYRVAIMAVLVFAASWLTTTGLVRTNSSSALAYPAKPVTNWGYYIQDLNYGGIESAGCNQAEVDARTSGDSTVILDFGGQLPDGTGTLLTNGTYVTNSQIESMAEQFGIGYISCDTGAKTGTNLVVGTNNSLGNGSSLGATWAYTVKTVANNLAGYAGVVVIGGNDIETFGDTTDSSTTKAWARGYYNTHVNLDFLNYGSADGCPEASYNNSMSCNGAYTQYDYWYLSWGNPAAVGDPEIYFNGTQQEWTMISRYGAAYQNGPVPFLGVLDEHDLDSSSYTSTEAWNNFWGEMSKYPATSSSGPIFSTEIHQEYPIP